MKLRQVISSTFKFIRDIWPSVKLVIKLLAPII
jgi:hypothetical protein